MLAWPSHAAPLGIMQLLLSEVIHKKAYHGYSMWRDMTLTPNVLGLITRGGTCTQAECVRAT